MPIDTPRGMDDLLPREVALKRRIEEVIREVFKLYGYLEIETPTVEYYELFAMKSGEEIRERMFEFEDKAGRKLVLRPEVTASIARLVSTKLKVWPQPLRLGYIADCYRYDEPQWGRRRRFWQGGFELFGSRSPLADAEILQVSREVFNRIGLRNHFFKVGHVGIIRKLLAEFQASERDQDRILTMLDRKLVNDAITLMKKLEVEGEAIKAIQELVKLEGYDHERIFKEASEILSPWK
ncbi:MAG TPA: histidine--tRNA ligase family protein, partial [Nitrososphaeria archaeon]|nr:histidine--tRNA ligase family protein [Nitrososphaeria archaeon]